MTKFLLSITERLRHDIGMNLCVLQAGGPEWIRDHRHRTLALGHKTCKEGLLRH